ncbi:tRNA (guanosine(46)-N7)-methyltransferase TrmB [Microbacterium dextranolyticum]|uniref:tRNA (guanine-N(7)-)-methyltransferase n=1 Tax=Microbacterium dextranolyticum TaxID=36806 RepID=A0A9W6HNJ0_9MICO|nr:tRNA (guanosine(46)-N7)-methyltransferase TrmB [Microbacterium dextranolyticum]MBM7463668.1 tRNA (guanine-N7-)-methyltransferase [Microbacterium dextranolyticum]GLJ96501.1 tRNA (guanine-N(7)-)-methyltransferase [Microbacterium dextranolyticum]
MPNETENTPRFRDKPVSFVRRSGRMSDAQERAWAELSPRYVIDVQRDAAATSILPGSPLAPSEAYGRTAPLIVEIGSGQGHAIVHAAAQAPGTDFLAVEVFRAGLARTMLDADRAGIRNLRLVEANAPEVLEHLLPEASVDEVWIFFPDPWHKSKHNKRRLIAPVFPPLAARALRDGGLLRLATDWEDYALQMRDVMADAEGFAPAFAGEWAPRFDGRTMTAFERKGIAKGRDIRDLVYRRAPRAAAARP